MSARTRLACLVVGAAGVAGMILGGGCPPTPNGGASLPVFNNTTDPTNDGAAYIGSAACKACHPAHASLFEKHGHSRALNPTTGAAPVYPPAGTRAGVPDPPDGRTWDDVSYVIGGYLLGANFVDSSGYLLTDGVEGVHTQWNLAHPIIGVARGFAAFMPGQTEPLPYDYQTCFRCHTTGPRPQDPADPRSQDGRPGILGTWSEPGVTCEACHGPGSNHVPRTARRDIFVDPTAATCGRCHAAGDDPATIVAVNGYIVSNSQYSELLASGGHARFSCTVCHDPHASIAYDRENGWRNRCTACHTDMNLAFHDGAVYTRGGYTEQVQCESCHMPLTGLGVASAGEDIVGTFGGRAGDVRGHIFRIDTTSDSYLAMFTPDGSEVRTDAQGRAAVTLDFVCLRCHNTQGNVFALTTAGARQIAQGMHTKAAQSVRPVIPVIPE